MLGCAAGADAVSGRTLRSKVEKSVEVAERVFAVGSLAGDSLIRFAYGGCVLAAKSIIAGESSSKVSVEEPTKLLVNHANHACESPMSAENGGSVFHHSIPACEP